MESTLQKVFCANCGQALERDFMGWPYKPTCGKDCWKEFEMKQCCSIIGKVYQPKAPVGTPPTA